MKELIVLVLSGAITLSSYEVNETEKSKDSIPQNQVLNTEEHVGNNAIHSTSYSATASDNSSISPCETITDK